MIPKFEDTYKKYFSYVVMRFSYLGREAAEEYAQDVMTLVATNYSKYDPKHKMSTFIEMFITNVWSDITRRHMAKGRDQATTVPIEDADNEAAEDQFEMLDKRLDAPRMIAATCLNPAELAIVTALINNQYYDDISKSTGRSYDYTKRTAIIAIKKINTRNNKKAV